MNWTKVAATALLIAGPAVYAGPLRAAGDGSGRETRGGETSIEETWARVAPEMGRNLPMKVDEKTTWLTVSNDGPVLISTFRMDLTRVDVLDLKSKMERSAIENTCRRTQHGKELLDAGGIVRQVFQDQTGQHAFTIDVDSASYQ